MTAAVENPNPAGQQGQPRRAARRGTLRTDPVLARVISEMRDVPGVCAIGVGGSRSTGTATPQSDYDVIVFCRKDSDLDRKVLHARLVAIGVPEAELNKPLAEVDILGRKVELFFRPMDKLATEIETAKKGQFRRTMNPLHTIGFLSTILVSYATYTRPIWDPEGVLKRLIQSAFPYPEALRERMISTFRTEAKLALMHAAKTRTTIDIAHLMGLYSRANAAWALMLFAINRRYPIIDKGGRRLVATFPVAPSNYLSRSAAVFRLAAEGNLQGALDVANRLHNEVTALARDGKKGERQAQT